jgi:hypothetical protein
MRKWYWLWYSRITSTKSSPFCMKTFSASLTNLMLLLSLSVYFSCYVSRRILTPQSLWLHKHTAVRSQEFVQSPDLWHQPRLSNVTCVWSWRLCGSNPLTQEITRSGSSLFLFHKDYFYIFVYIYTQNILVVMKYRKENERKKSNGKMQRENNFDI